MKPLAKVDLSGKADDPQLAGPGLYLAFRRALEGISTVVTIDGSAMALIIPGPGFADLARDGLE